MLMRKFFTLIAVAAMAITASAQGTYQYDSESAVAAGTTVDAVPNCTLTFGAAGGAEFKAAKADSHLTGFTKFCEGNGTNGNYTDGAPVGTCYELKPALSGKITVAVVLNAEKAFFVRENGEALADYNGIKVDVKYYGTYSFDVVGGKTYDVYCTGSKLGFYGFTYEATGGDTPAPAEGETFTLEGAWPEGDFGTIKTPISIDYDTKTITFDKFLGGSASLVVKYELRSQSQDPTMPGTMFNIILESGATANGEIGGATTYDLDGLKDASVIFTDNDGNNVTKLNNPQIIFGTYSCIEFKTGGKYEISLYMVGKYSKWENGDWGAVSSGNGFFNLVITVPASAGGPTDAIDAVAADVDEDAPVEYYNIQGMRVANPAPGQLVIRRQGNKVSKVIFR